MKFNINDPSTYPRRQVHLDFHTSPLMPNVGSAFDKKQFQQALKDGHINSITIFAKCHHGYCYYPTKVGSVHPTLDFDLLGEMIDAAHEIGVRAPIYITAGWSHLDAEQHPEWTARRRDGGISTGPYDLSADPDEPKEIGTWIDMCLNDGDYCKHIYELTEEICKRYNQVDGLFYDICFIHGTCLSDESVEGMKRFGLDPKNREDVEKYFLRSPCYCETCVNGMKAMGLDPDCYEDAKKYDHMKHIEFMKKCGSILRSYHPNATIFFNSGGADPYQPEFHPYSSHFEMEDLPTAEGGYNRMPLNAKFFGNTGKFYLGMTGKFHLAWGEFGGFKPKEALRYEVCNMAVYGAGCSIGDQLFPDGVMEQQTYENIGYAYAYLEKIEPYCYGGESTARLGFILSNNCDTNSGLVNILIENQIDFDIITDDDFSGYDAIILPSEMSMTAKRLEAIRRYTGNIIAMGNSIIRDGEFLLDCGLTSPKAAPFDCDYILPFDTLAGDLPRTPFLINIPGFCAENKDAEIFAEILQPFFSRTYGKFCSHRNTPYDKQGKRYPALARKGKLIWLAHDIPLLYRKLGCIFHKRYFISALSMLFDNPCRVDMPSGGRCRLIRQPREHRYCLNMTYASSYKRGDAEIIDEILPIFNIGVRIKLSENIRSVRTLIAGENIEFRQSGGILEFAVPRLECHECIIIEY